MPPSGGGAGRVQRVAVGRPACGGGRAAIGGFEERLRLVGTAPRSPPLYGSCSGSGAVLAPQRAVVPAPGERRPGSWRGSLRGYWVPVGKGCGGQSARRRVALPVSICSGGSSSSPSFTGLRGLYRRAASERPDVLANKLGRLWKAGACTCSAVLWLEVMLLIVADLAPLDAKARRSDPTSFY